jgi:Bacterial PH domain
MQDQEDGPPSAAVPRYVIRYTQSFDTAIEAGKFLHARALRAYYLVFGAGLVIGALVSLIDLFNGLFILVFSALMLITTRFALLDRLFGRRRARSVLGQPIQLDIGDDGIRSQAPQGTTHIPWSSLTEVRSNERTVIFVRDRLLLAYAPAVSFASVAEQAEVVVFSRDQIAAAMASGA